MGLFHGTHSALVCLGPSPAVGHQGCCGVWGYLGGGRSPSAPEGIGTDGCAMGLLRSLGQSWGSVLGGFQGLGLGGSVRSPGGSLWMIGVVDPGCSAQGYHRGGPCTAMGQ